MKKLIILALWMILLCSNNIVLAAESYDDVYNQACQMAQQEKYPEALSKFTKAIALNPKSADAFENRGYIYFIKENYTKAISDFTEAIKINPNHYGAYIDRGKAYGETKKFKEAIADFSKAIKLKPENSLAYYYRGLSYAKDGTSEKAYEDIKKAADLGDDKAKEMLSEIDQSTHQVYEAPSLEAPVTAEKVSEVMNNSVKKYKNGDTVPRISFYNIAFPSNYSEYKKLNTVCVAMITVQCHNKKELPIKRVFIKTKVKEYRLNNFFVQTYEVIDEPSTKIFGPWRQDLYCYVPYMLTKADGELCIDWEGGRNSFVVAKLPLKTNISYIKSDNDLRFDVKKDMDLSLLGVFMKREFGFSDSDLKQISENK